MPKSHIALSLVACFVIAAPAAGAGNSYDGSYSGQRRLTKGDAPLCIEEEPVSAVISGTTLKFTNSRLKDYAIDFDPRSDGSFDMTNEDIGGDVTDIWGHITATTIDADVTDYSTRCVHHWHLVRQRRN